MKRLINKFKSLEKTALLSLAVLVILILVVIFGGYKYSRLSVKFASADIEFRNKIKKLEEGLLKVKSENTELNDSLYAEQKRVESFAGELQQLTGKVNILDKLSKTDSELLQKYSKIYFLNENYQPPLISEINNDYLCPPGKKQYIHKSIEPFLMKLLEAAREADMDLKILSAFRSFAEQAELKSNYKITFGSGANKFSADQGYSEHQLGTAVDFTTGAMGSNFSKFENAKEYAWLANNAYRFGFILSYPKNNAYYIFEPWHWRFVGVDLAIRLRNDGIYFYDLSQREIDQYLAAIFD